MGYQELHQVLHTVLRMWLLPTTKWTTALLNIAAVSMRNRVAEKAQAV